jgi:hypothetical protein
VGATLLKKLTKQLTPRTDVTGPQYQGVEQCFRHPCRQFCNKCRTFLTTFACVELLRHKHILYVKLLRDDHRTYPIKLTNVELLRQLEFFKTGYTGTRTCAPLAYKLTLYYCAINTFLSNWNVLKLAILGRESAHL